MKCDCKDWQDNIGKVNAPSVLQSVRSAFAFRYDGVKFRYCPWCSKELREDEPRKPREWWIQVKEDNLADDAWRKPMLCRTVHVREVVD